MHFTGQRVKYSKKARH